MSLVPLVYYGIVSRFPLLFSRAPVTVALIVPPEFKRKLK